MSDLMLTRTPAFSPPSTSKDRMYWIEKEGQGYVPLDEGKQRQLEQGKARL